MKTYSEAWELQASLRNKVLEFNKQAISKKYKEVCQWVKNNKPEYAGVVFVKFDKDIENGRFMVYTSTPKHYFINLDETDIEPPILYNIPNILKIRSANQS